MEGRGYGYDRLEIWVPGHGQCFTYLAPEEHCNDSLVPYTWYRDLVLIGCRYHAFPEPYVQSVASHTCRNDPKLERAAENGAILQKALAYGT